VIEFYVEDDWRQVAHKVEKIMGCRMYVLHNQVGSTDWYVRPVPSMHISCGCLVGLIDPEMATLVRLKL
jgi:hypothetical protein